MLLQVATSSQNAECVQPQNELLNEGTFVLVKFYSQKKKSFAYKYVCKIIQRLSDNEFVVAGYKTKNREKTTFKAIPNDESSIDFSDVLLILPAPSVTIINEHYTEYTFPLKIDTNEP